MKKLVLFIFSFIFIMSVNAESLNSKFAYIYNVKEDKVMYELNSNEIVKVASLTKIMTAIIAIENNLDLSKEVIMINSDFRDMYEYAVAGFSVGDRVTIKDLLYGVLLPSGSDAVNAIVRITTETELDFIKLMNDKVKELGLKNTYFSNAIGKDEGNYSTMYDISKILLYALENDTFKEIFTTAVYKVNNLELKGPLYRINSNLVDGAKTGFTDYAMYCLASFSEKDNFNYVVITSYANSYKEVIEDHKNIYEYYNNNYKYYDYTVNFNLDIKNGKEDYYDVSLNNKVYLKKDYNKDLLIYKYDGINEINKNIKKGDKLGVVSIYYDNELLKQSNIYLNEDIEYKNYIWIIFLSILMFIIIMIKIKDKKSKKR